MTQPQPQVGDTWEVRAPGKNKKVKVVGSILPGLHGDGVPYISWERRSKGRYTGIRVHNLLLWGKRLSTKAEREEHFKNMVNTQRARLGKQPL